MKHVYFFRHGETVLNAQQVLQGHIAFPELNEKGIEQAKTIIQKLKDVPLQVIYSSPLKRARQTADIVNTQFNVPIIEDARLKEMCLGDLEGMTVCEAKTKYPEVMDTFFSDDESKIENRCPNGESFKELGERIKDFFDGVVCSCSEKHIGIAGHGMLLKYAVYSCGCPLMVGAPENAAVAHFTCQNNQWQFLGFI